MELAGPTPENDDPNDKLTSDEQVRRAFEACTHEDFARLGTAAKALIRKYQLDRFTYLPKDLVNEAVFRTLEGRRRWRFEKVEFVYFLGGVMRSIASHIYEERKKLTPLDSDYADPAPPIGYTDDEEPYPELADLESAFADDPEIWQFLLLKAEGKTVAQIAVAMGKNTRETEAIKKRTNRRILKISRRVGKHGEQKAKNG